jgi:hypothetical protein
MTTATTISRSSEDNDNNINSLSLRQAIDYSLDVLKIKSGSEFYRNIPAKFMSQIRVPLPMTKTHGNWITAMKLIADCNGTLNCNSNSNDDHVFSQT